MSNEEGAAKTSDLLVCKGWSHFFAQGSKVAKGLVTVVTLATHFLISTQTRTLCLLRLELSIPSLTPPSLAEERPESKTEHRGLRMKLRPNTHEHLLFLRSKDYPHTTSHTGPWSCLCWTGSEYGSCESSMWRDNALMMCSEEIQAQGSFSWRRLGRRVGFELSFDRKDEPDRAFTQTFPMSPSDSSVSL